MSYASPPPPPSITPFYYLCSHLLRCTETITRKQWLSVRSHRLLSTTPLSPNQRHRGSMPSPSKKRIYHRRSFVRSFALSFDRISCLSYRLVRTFISIVKGFTDLAFMEILHFNDVKHYYIHTPFNIKRRFARYYFGYYLLEEALQSLMSHVFEKISSVTLFERWRFAWFPVDGFRSEFWTNREALYLAGRLIPVTYMWLKTNLLG